MWRKNFMSFFALVFFSLFTFASSSIECGVPIFKKPERRSLFRRRTTNLDDVNGDDNDHESEAPQVLYFLALGLILGVITSFSLSRLNSKLPYTVVMFCEGVLAAVLSLNLDEGESFEWTRTKNLYLTFSSC
jgi:hypothetical protein